MFNTLHSESKIYIENGRFYQHKNITVFGLHRSGVAVARLLDDLGANVSVTDPKSASQLHTDLEAFKGRNIEFFLGGHDHRCIERAEMIVVSPGVPLDIPILTEARSIGIPIAGELEVASSVCPAPIVAITGTKGKSTTTLLTAEILKAGGQFRKVAIAGNIGIPLSDEVQNLTADDIAVIETSSFQLETTSTFRPVVAVILNLSRDHLDRHETMEAYQAAKRKIYANQTSKDFLVLNADDALVAGFACDTKAKVVYFTDMTAPTSIWTDATQISFSSQPSVLRTKATDKEILVEWRGDSRRVCDISDIRLFGRHNVQNVLAATAVGQILGVPVHRMRAAIHGFSSTQYPALDHALEYVTTIKGVQFINDSKATNVAAVKAAVESFSAPILLIMGGVDKGNHYEPLIDLVRSKVKGLILLGSNTKLIRNALAPYVVTWDAATMLEAVKVANMNAEPGDVVLLSPANASFDMFDDYRARGRAFREATNQLELGNAT